MKVLIIGNGGREHALAQVQPVQTLAQHRKDVEFAFHATPNCGVRPRDLNELLSPAGFKIL